MRSKYCFRPEDLPSAVFWFDNVYIRATTEHPEDLFTLYVCEYKKEKKVNLRALQDSGNQFFGKRGLQNLVAEAKKKRFWLSIIKP